MPTPKVPSDFSYERALEALERLQRRLEQQEVPIDELEQTVAEAQALLQHCQQRLRSISDAVQQSLSAEQEG
jgi:exodeoxyribonuclease VII small subunit